MDNWTPPREFFMLNGALNYRMKHQPSHLFRWRWGNWQEAGALELTYILSSG
jgi:hypothetical protein